MAIRTDIATEFAADKTESDNGVTVKKYSVDGIVVTNVEILNENAAAEIGKQVGKYVTVESESSLSVFGFDKLRELLIAEIRGMLGKLSGTVLVAGIGNSTVTPDALGPRTAAGILATRHISGELANEIGLKGLRPVSVITPGVVGQTGIETGEIVLGAVEKVRPEAVVIIDALAARDISRLCRTVQLSNTGISPGSGVGNTRTELTEKTLGVRCVTIGVPTVVDADTLCYGLTGKSAEGHEPFIVTPRDIDRLIDESVKALAYSVNVALQPEINPETLMACV